MEGSPPRDEAYPSRMSLQIDIASEADHQAIADVTAAAFGEAHGQELVELVSALASDPSGQPSLSLVATRDHNVVGHVLFTKVRIAHASRETRAAILAPLSVHPEYQDQGIGGQVIQEGLRQLQAAGVELVFVLGHPGYYPKHGFSPAGAEGLDAPYPIAPENSAAWMVQELQPGVLGQVSGVVMCADSLNEPRHWQE